MPVLSGSLSKEAKYAAKELLTSMWLILLEVSVDVTPKFIPDESGFILICHADYPPDVSVTLGRMLFFSWLLGAFPCPAGYGTDYLNFC